MTMIKINREKLHGLLDAYNAEHGTNTTGLSRQMGRTDSYLHNIMSRGTIPPNAMTMLSLLFGIKPEDYVWTHEDEEPDPPQAPEWMVEYKVEPEKARVLVRVNRGGEELVYGYSKIREPAGPLQILQAISYASHQCYKKVEQEELEAL